MKVCSHCQRCYEDSAACCAEVDHPALSEKPGASPEMVPGYRLECLLGSGLKGELYQAREASSGASCIIKILPANSQNGEQFLYEAKLATSLFNPSVVDIYDAGTLESGELFVVAEDAEGQTVREMLQTTGPPHLLTTIRVIEQVAEALHAIHLKGITHRAVRPENIVVAQDHEQRPIARIQNPDFGGVVERSIVSNKFLIDTALDSLRYYAPEQCLRETVGLQADVYSLGIVFYEMLAGVPPFDAAKASALIEKHRREHPPEIRIDNFELRMLITHSLMESLQKQPAVRNRSANAFARQLRHIEQLATHVSTPPPAGVVPKAPPRPAVTAFNSAAPVAPPEPSPVHISPPSSAEEPPKIVFSETGESPATLAPQNISVDVSVIEDKPFVEVEPEVLPAVTIEAVESAAPVIESGTAEAFETETAVAFQVEAEPVTNIEVEFEPVAECSIEKEPARLLEDESRLEVESEPVPYVEYEDVPVVPDLVVNDASIRTETSGETIWAVDFEIPVPVTPEPKKAIRHLPAVDEIDYLKDVPTARRHSRLKLLRRWITEHVQLATAKSEVVSRDEALDIKPIKFASVPLPAELAERRKSEAVSAVRQPRKIEWELPEDDIPTEADVLAAQMQDEMAVAVEIQQPAPLDFQDCLAEIDVQPVKEPLPIEISLAEAVVASVDIVAADLPTPVVIELAAPDDTPIEVLEQDIEPVVDDPKDEPVEIMVEGEPLVEEIRDEPLAVEAVHEPVFEIEVENEQPVQVLKVESEPAPTIDLNSFGDDLLEIPDLLFSEPVDQRFPRKQEAPPVRKVSPPQLPEPKTIPPAKIVESKPVRAAAPQAQTPAVVAKAKTTAATAVRKAPKKIRWEQPVDDIPNNAEALEVIAKDQMPIVRKEPRAIPVLPPEPDEITLVTSGSKPRRVERGRRNVPQRRSPNQPYPYRESEEVTYFPTILIDLEKRETFGPDRGQPIFSAFYDSSGRVYSHRRSMMIGGMMMIVAALLFGRGTVWRYIQTVASADPIASRTTTEQKSLPQLARTSGITQSKQKLMKSFEKPEADEAEMDVDKLRPLSINERVPVARERSRDSVGKTVIQSETSVPEQSPKPRNAGRSSGNSPSLQSTLVISSDNGRVKSRVEPDPKPGEKRSPGQFRASGGTRPRIVEDPQR
jgi:eukaryotic-like serine/threonine-protein kinase